VGSKAFATFAMFLTVLLIGQAIIDTMPGRIAAIIGETGVWAVMIVTVFNNYKEEDNEDNERKDS
jgi:hypothetical protein